MRAKKATTPNSEIFKNIHGNAVLLLNIPTKEDCERVHRILTEIHDTTYSKASMVNACKSTNEKTLIMFIKEGGLYTRVLGDGTHEAYKQGFIPLDKFYQKYDKALLFENFNTALNILEESLQG